jgi:hypothetical protein
MVMQGQIGDGKGSLRSGMTRFAVAFGIPLTSLGQHRLVVQPDPTRGEILRLSRSTAHVTLN